VTRLNLFHKLPGVWEEGEFYNTVWTQIRRQLARGEDLNASERLVLVELLSRVANKPAARKALGIRPKARTAARNERIADLFIKLHEFDAKTRAAAEAAVMRKFQVGAATVRAVTDSNAWLGPARTRQLTEQLAKKQKKRP
jgi:hypothetical protein